MYANHGAISIEAHIVSTKLQSLAGEVKLKATPQKEIFAVTGPIKVHAQNRKLFSPSGHTKFPVCA